MTAFPINITLVTANLINNFCKSSKLTFIPLKKNLAKKTNQNFLRVLQIIFCKQFGELFIHENILILLNGKLKTTSNILGSNKDNDNNIYRKLLFSLQYCSWKEIFQIHQIVKKIFFWNANSNHAIVEKDMTVREWPWTAVAILLMSLTRHKQYY